MMPISNSTNEPGGYVYEGISNSCNEPPVLPAGVYAPNVTTLTPSTVAAGSADFTLNVSGTGFFAKSVIFVNNGNQVTAFNSGNGQVSALIKPSSYTPQTVKIWVKNGAYSSNQMNFVFT